MPRLVLIRHGRPEVVGGAPPSARHLAEGSYDAVRRLSTRLRLGRALLVLASTEPKALETAHALQRGPVHASGAFGEIRKPWYQDPQQQREATAGYLAGDAVDGWEPLGAAARRFDEGLPSDHDVEDVVVVSHGTIMSAWLGWRSVTADPFGFWSDLQMPDAWEIDLARRGVRRIAPSADE